MKNAFANEQWFKIAKRFSLIAWILCGGVFLSYVGFLNVVVQPWHIILGIGAALFTVGAVILVFISDKYIKLSEKEAEKHQDSGEEK